MNKDGNESFESNLFSRTFYEKSFSKEQQSEIYKASIEAVYEQYKGGKQVNLTEVFMDNIEKSDKFNDEEKKKLKELSLKSEEAVKDVENISEPMKNQFELRLKRENKDKSIDRDEENSFDSKLFDRVYADKSFSDEQKAKIFHASIEAMYKQYKGGKQVNLTEVFMDNIEKSDKFNDEEKKKLKEFSLKSEEDVKDVEKLPERLVKHFEKMQSLEEDTKKKEDFNNTNTVNDSEYNVYDVVNKQKEELEKVKAEDAKWKEEQDRKDKEWKLKIQKGKQDNNDMKFITSFMLETMMLTQNPDQTKFIFDKITRVSARLLGDNGGLSDRADTLLKKSIKDSDMFSNEDKERFFEAMDKHSNKYVNDERKPSDIKIEVKKENVINTEKVEQSQLSESLNIKKDTHEVKTNETRTAQVNEQDKTFDAELDAKMKRVENSEEFKKIVSSANLDEKQQEAVKKSMAQKLPSEYIESAQSKIDKENAPIGFASRILVDMDKNPNISKEMKDMFLDMAIKTSKEVSEQGLKLGSFEGVEAFAEIIGKKMKDNKEFGENGLKNVKETMEKGEYFNQLSNAKNLTNKVLNAGIDDKPLENKKEEVKIEKISNEEVSKGKSVEETLVDEVIKKGNLSKEAGDEILNIAVQMEQARLNGESLNGKTYSEAFMDKVIASKEISEKDKNKLLDMAIKTESREIAKSENGKRLYFDESKMARFDQLNLSEDMKKALDFEVKDGKFSVKIPEDDAVKKEVINRIKVQVGKEKIQQMKKDENQKSNVSDKNNFSSNMALFMDRKNNSR